MKKLRNIVGLVVDDHQLFCDSFSGILEKTQLFSVIHCFANSKELLQYFVKNSRNKTYLFLDYYLKDEIGLGVLNDIYRLNKNVSTIVISSVTNIETIRLIKSYNPEGFISKSAGFDIVLDCLNNIEKGKTYYCPFFEETIKNNADKEVTLFSSTELEVLQYFAKGYSVIQTAEAIYRSKHTVVAHRRNMMEKANCNTITELLTYARKSGFIED